VIELLAESRLHANFSLDCSATPTFALFLCLGAIIMERPGIRWITRCIRFDL
jgi:hypothetical protein